MLITFPNEFIYLRKLSNHNSIKEKLLPKIQSEYQSTKDMQKNIWLCDVNTEFFKKDQDISKYIELITQGIYPVIDDLFDTVDELKKPSVSTVTRIWYNHYESGGNQEVHTHSKVERTPVILSGVYFLELQEVNPLVFFSPLAASNSLVTESRQVIEAEEGCIALFPSFMPHYVLQCTKPRTTIAFNISMEFQ